MYRRLQYDRNLFQRVNMDGLKGLPMDAIRSLLIQYQGLGALSEKPCAAFKLIDNKGWIIFDSSGKYLKYRSWWHLLHPLPRIENHCEKYYIWTSRLLARCIG